MRQEVRAQVVGLLNRRLAEVIDLGTQSARAPSPLRGPQFVALHQFFDEVHDTMEDYVDLLTERVVQIGGTPTGAARTVAVRSALPVYSRAPAAGAEPVHALANALTEFGGQVRQATSRIRDWGDHESAAICTEISQRLDQWQWFVAAHGRNRAEAAPLTRNSNGGSP